MAMAKYLSYAVCIAILGFQKTTAEEMNEAADEYTSYTSWSECTVSCGGGFSYRVRECKDLTGGSECEKSQRKPCNDQPCEANSQENVVAENLDVAKKVEVPEAEVTERVVIGGFDITSEEMNKGDLTKAPEEESMVVVEELTATAEKSETHKTKETEGVMAVAEKVPAAISTVEKIKPTKPKKIKSDKTVVKEENAKTSTTEESKPSKTKEKSKEYVDYSAWTQCTVSCGGGFSYRVRECKELSGEKDCEKSESKPCNEEPCDTNETEPQITDLVETEPKEKEATLTEGGPGGLLFNIVEGEVGGREIKKIPVPSTTKKPLISSTASTVETSKVVLATASKTSQSPQKSKDCRIELQASNTVQQYNPKNFRNNKLSCEWIIKAEEGKQIMAQIQYSNQNQCCDKFQIYDGETSLAQLNGAQNFREKYVTKSDSFKISFQGTYGKEYRNFIVFYVNYPVPTPVPISKAEMKVTQRPETSSANDGKCDRRIRVTKETQELDSGLFKKNKKYNCMLQLIAPGGGMIKTKITYYNTAKCCAYMEVYDGNKLLKRYDGTVFVKADDFTIESGLLLILYKNPASDGYSRIRARHRLLPAKLIGTVVPQKKPGFTHTTRTPVTSATSTKPTLPSKQQKFTKPTSPGHIYSMGMATTAKNIARRMPAMCSQSLHAMYYIRSIYGPYVKNHKQYKCEWKVIAPKGKSIQTIIYFYKTMNGGDYLQVFDGDKLLANLYGNYQQQQEFKTSSNMLILKYTSSYGSRGRQFRASYKIRRSMDKTHQCGTTLNAKSYVAKYKSPHFEQGKLYDCEWNIVAPVGSRLKVQLYYHNTEHCCDVMKVKEGARILDVISTKTYSHTMYNTKSNNLKLQFKGKGGNGVRRFVVYYTVDPGTKQAMYRAHPQPHPETSHHHRMQYHPQPHPETMSHHHRMQHHPRPRPEHTYG